MTTARLIDARLALRGFDALSQDTYATFAEANWAEHDLEQIADGLVRIALRNLP